MTLKTEICNAFNQHAAEYDTVAKVQNEIGERLFERLDYLKITPRYVLDLGCGTGIFTARLKKKYPNAHIIALDLSTQMLIQSRKKQRLWRKWPLINADMSALPFANGVFDLVFANQVIHWANPLSSVFSELNRVMNVNGCLMFSTLGPDTFKELKSAWASVDKYAHVNSFIDMHDYGDMLLAEQFLDPVMDMEHLTVHYQPLSQLTQALKAQGVRNINAGRRKGLMGRSAWQAFELGYQAWLTPHNKYPLTYEVVYGHAWRGEPKQIRDGMDTFIPISEIKRRS